MLDVMFNVGDDKYWEREDGSKLNTLTRRDIFYTHVGYGRTRTVAFFQRRKKCNNMNMFIIKRPRCNIMCCIQSFAVMLAVNIFLKNDPLLCIYTF